MTFLETWHHEDYKGQPDIMARPGWTFSTKFVEKNLHFHDFQYFPISFKNRFDFFGNLTSWGLWGSTGFQKYMAGRLRYNGKTKLNVFYKIGGGISILPDKLQKCVLPLWKPDIMRIMGLNWICKIYDWKAET